MPVLLYAVMKIIIYIGVVSWALTLVQIFKCKKIGGRPYNIKALKLQFILNKIDIIFLLNAGLFVYYLDIFSRSKMNFQFTFIFAGASLNTVIHLFLNKERFGEKFFSILSVMIIFAIGIRITYIYF